MSMDIIIKRFPLALTRKSRRRAGRRLAQMCPARAALFRRPPLSLPCAYRPTALALGSHWFFLMFCPKPFWHLCINAPHMPICSCPRGCSCRFRMFRCCDSNLGHVSPARTILSVTYKGLVVWLFLAESAPATLSSLHTCRQQMSSEMS